MTELPAELQALAALLDAQPGHVQVAFQYCLALLMVEDGKASLIATTPGESGAICTFQTVAGKETPRLTHLDDIVENCCHRRAAFFLRRIGGGSKTE